VQTVSARSYASREAAARPYHSNPGGAGSPSTEWSRFSSGLSAYLHRPLIPYGHAYPDEGRPRFNLNRFVADGDMEIAEIIERNLPAFEERKGGFPVNPVDADVADYTATIAANLIDYADENATPSLPSTTKGAGNRVFRPKEIELILLVKHLLYEEKYTIEGANKRLAEMRKEGGLEEERQDVLEPEFLARMKADLQELRETLTPPERRED